MESNAQLYLLETYKSFKGLKSLSEKAIEQLSDDELYIAPNVESNSIAVIIQHLSGNMLSRFTDFLTSDGEKEWRDRDAEFIDSRLSRADLIVAWNKGWDCVLSAVNSLSEEHLSNKVFIRGEEQTVLRALQRQMVHYAYHTGQIVYLCKQVKKTGFKTLSIARGESSTFVPGKK